MGPHKNPDQLSVSDQLKLLRKQSDDIQFEVSSTRVKLEVTKNQVEILRTEIKDFKKELKQEIRQKFDKIMSKIDKFIGRIDTQDKEIAAIAFRKEEHENRISKLEKSGKFLAA